MNANPTKPIPSKTTVAGSGTTLTKPFWVLEVITDPNESRRITFEREIV